MKKKKKKEKGKFDCSKMKNYFLPRDRRKDKPQRARRHLEYAQPAKDWYPECIKTFYKYIGKREAMSKKTRTGI